jgi:hypothetical protein
MRPGARAVVTSKTVRGQYRIEEMLGNGSSRAGSIKVKLILKNLEGIAA